MSTGKSKMEHQNELSTITEENESTVEISSGIHTPREDSNDSYISIFKKSEDFKSLVPETSVDQNSSSYLYSTSSSGSSGVSRTQQFIRSILTEELKQSKISQQKSNENSKQHNEVVRAIEYNDQSLQSKQNHGQQSMEVNVKQKDPAIYTQSKTEESISPESLYSRVINDNFQSRYRLIKRACDGVDFEDEKLPELSEVSFSQDSTSHHTNIMPNYLSKNCTSNCRKSDAVDAEVACAAANKTHVSTDQKSIEIAINRMLNKIGEIDSQLSKFECRQKEKLEMIKRLQQQYEGIIENTRLNQNRRTKVLQESRCIQTRNAKLAADASNSKQSAQKSQNDLRSDVSKHMQFQQELHRQGKTFTQNYDTLQSELLKMTGTSRTTRQIIGTLQQDIVNAELNLQQGQNHLQQVQKTFSSQKQLLSVNKEKIEVIKEQIRRNKDTLSKRQNQINQVQEGKDAGQKLLDASQKETESYTSKTNVLLAGMPGKQDILSFLQDEVKILRKDSGDLCRTVAGRKGQVDHLNKIIETRTKECKEYQLSFQVAKQTLQSLQIQCCDKLTDETVHDSTCASSYC